MIRPATPEDMPAIVDIWRRASRLAQPFLDEEAWTARAEEMTRQRLPDCRIQVLDAGGRAVGFAAMRGEHLEALFVDPKAQGYGHGSALMAHVMALSERITLRVFSRNVRAVSFYRRLGFHAYLETEDPASGEPETLMVWTRRRSCRGRG
ncbi:GNAT family N-acetyltransferase [Halomonas maura]|uniref:GNAT family N-acetyltransferase n=1 Tax=Halomonas maura TaxID=117606 RepID=UPI0025B2D73B|nr:GNAT family N-acetyltransferase [Halomonas maura]MDN3557996.1 GNAT family N-acetyltransferase [Halomonas maura]